MGTRNPLKNFLNKKWTSKSCSPSKFTYRVVLFLIFLHFENFWYMGTRNPLKKFQNQKLTLKKFGKKLVTFYLLLKSREDKKKERIKIKKKEK